MKRKFIIMLFLIFQLRSVIAYSQGSDLPQSLSYDQAISFAMENNPDLRIKQLNHLIFIEKLNESKLDLVPQVYGRYDLQRNLIIPSTLVPVGKFNPSLPPDEMVPIKFGTNWSSVIGLFASVKLYDPQIIGSIRENRASLLLSEIESEITKIDIEIETGKAYASSLLSEEQLEFAEDDTINSYRELEESESKYRAGLLKMTDYNHAIINHTNTVSRFKEAYKILIDSRRTLLYWMGISNESFQSFTLADTLEVLISRLSSDVKNNEDLRTSLTLSRLSALNNIDKVRLKNTKAGFLPVISLNGLYTSDYYNSRLHLGDENFWFGNSNINLSLRIPVTEGISRTKKIAQQKYQIDANHEGMTAALNKKELEKNQTIRDIEFYGKESGIKRSNLELTRSNYRAAFSQFSAGRILQSELSNAELSYKQAKIDYLQVVYDYIDAMLTLRRIVRS